MEVREPSAKYLARSGYKQTEVGVIPEDWESTTVRDLASPGRNAIVGGPFGSDLVSNDYVEDGVPVVRGQNMGCRFVSGRFAFVSRAKASSLEANLACPGDLVFTQRGTLGQVSLVPHKPYDRYLISQSQMKLTGNRKAVDPLFFYYVFSSTEQQEFIRQNTIQTGVPHINLGILRAIPVQRPSLAEQETIAEALSDADGFIESLEQLLAKKRHLKQGAMQELLTGKKRLPGFSGEWEVKLFDGVLIRLNAKAHQIQTSDYQTAGRYPVVDQGKEHVTGFSDRHDKRFQCPEGGVIVFGDHTCIVKFIDFDFLIGADGTQVLQGKSGQCTRFHALQLQHRGVEPTGYNRHFKFLKQREFLAPPPIEQTAIAAILSDMDAEIAALEGKLAKARSLKQGMMQELLTGRIRLV